jgi:hypothetical protein
MCFSQSFKIHIAKSSGLWSDPQNWNIQSRNDGINKHKFIIPKNISITVDKDVDDLGDVELYIYGNLGLASSTNLHLTSNSKIEINNGSITGNSANQKIKIGNEIKYKGNVDGVKTGYWLADHTTGSAPEGFVSFAILPGNFTNFNINKNGNTVELTWSNDQQNNGNYEIEKSKNGIDWIKIAVINSASNSNNSTVYSYTDHNIPESVVYYRLRLSDNGQSFYSSVKTIRVGEMKPPVKIYGFEKSVIIDLNNQVNENIVVSILNNYGKLISQQVYNNPSYKISFKLNNIVKGAYVIQVTGINGWSEAKKVIL